MEQQVKAIVRVLNADIPGKTKVLRGLAKIYGVSTQFSNAVCEVTGLDRNAPIGSLSDAQIKDVETAITNPAEKNIPMWMFNRQRDYETGEDKHLSGPTLKLRKEFDVRHMKKIKSYRGMRHAFGLPVRGQRTKGNFRKGKSVGVVKRKNIAAQKKK